MPLSDPRIRSSSLPLAPDVTLEDALVLPANSARPPAGTLSDAEVKGLVLRAARARSPEELHPVVRMLVLNRVALTDVIASLNEALRRARSNASHFDGAVLLQLGAVRAELDLVERERASVLAERESLEERLRSSEELADRARRDVEHAQQELLQDQEQRQQLYADHQALQAKFEEQTAALLLLKAEFEAIQHHLAQTQGALASSLVQGRHTLAECESLRAALATSQASSAELAGRLSAQERLVVDLRRVVRNHLFARSEQQKLLESLALETVQLRHAQGVTLPHPPAQVPGEAMNVVAFSSRAEITKLREQIVSGEAQLAQRDQMIAKLTTANTLTKSRLAEMETRLQQMDGTARSQAAAHDTIAKVLLATLPEEQREILSSASYDAASLALIAQAVEQSFEARVALPEEPGAFARSK